jgi:hypothetical protein
VLCQQPTDAIESRADVGQKGDRVRFLWWRCDLLRWAEGPSVLSVAVTVLPESGPKKLQFTLQAVLVTKGSGLCASVESTACMLEGWW